MFAQVVTMHEMQEQTFLDEAGIKVTRSRIDTPGESHSINGVTSVKRLQDDPKKWPAVVCIGLGVLIALGALGGGDFAQNATGFIFGGLIGVAGYFWFKSLKPTFHLVLRSASGESTALTSKDGAFLGRVVEAINQALASRS